MRLRLALARTNWPCTVQYSAAQRSASASGRPERTEGCCHCWFSRGAVLVRSAPLSSASLPFCPLPSARSGRLSLLAATEHYAWVLLCSALGPESSTPDWSGRGLGRRRCTIGHPGRARSITTVCRDQPLPHRLCLHSPPISFFKRPPFPLPHPTLAARPGHQVPRPTIQSPPARSCSSFPRPRRETFHALQCPTTALDASLCDLESIPKPTIHDASRCPDAACRLLTTRPRPRFSPLRMTRLVAILGCSTLQSTRPARVLAGAVMPSRPRL